MDEAVRPAGGPSRHFLCWLPLVAGAVTLLACWALLMVRLSGDDTSCFGGYSSNPLVGASEKLASEFAIGGVPGGGALAVVVYVGVSFVPFLLLWACLLLARRSRSVRFLATFSIMGTVLLAAYFATAFVYAIGELSHGGMFCDLAFLLVPIAGVIVAGGVLILSALTAWLIEHLTRPPAGAGRLS